MLKHQSSVRKMRVHGSAEDSKMPTEQEIIEAYVPDSIKQASRTFQMHKVASQITGLDEFTIEKVALYLGGRFAARRMKWRPVADGLVALRHLRR